MDDIAINPAIFEVIVTLIFKPGETWKLFCGNMIDSDKTWETGVRAFWLASG